VLQETVSGQDGVVEQARRQLEDLVPVWAVLDYTETRVVARELLLVKVSILGPEYLEQQLAGGPTHEPYREAPTPTQSGQGSAGEHTKLDREMELAHAFEHSADSPHPAHVPLTPTQALRSKHQMLQSIDTLAQQFGGKIVDVSENSVIVELAAKTSRVEAFLSLVKPFGVLESARTGLMAMPRTPINISPEDEDLSPEESVAVDASLLPPG